MPPDYVTELEKRVPEGQRSGKLDTGRWEVADHTILYEGGGAARGFFTSPCFAWNPDGSATIVAGDPAKSCVEINYGAMKSMRSADDAAPVPYVYAFYVFLGGVKTAEASGWIKLSNVVRAADVAAMGTHVPRAVRSFVSTKYVVKSAEDFGLDPATYSWTKLPAQDFAAAKVAPGDGSKQVKDYLLRDGNLLNLAYNTPRVGGVAADTFAIGHETVGFKRVRSTKQRPALVWAPTDLKRRPRIIFAYGEIAGRFGWVALPSFMRGDVARPAAASGGGADPCSGKPDGGFCDVILQKTGTVCKDGKTVGHATCPDDKPLCAGPGQNGEPLMCDG
ncbi:MAG: hypothetical protein JWP97_4285 [Labilithrix sp.]|nr:hypothetical protein [Labilithrix sp.]